MITPSFGLTATERVLPRLALDFTTASLDPRVTFTRSGATATRVNSSGLVEVVIADTPRFDFDPVTLACKGLLIEEQRTNIMLQSQDMSTVWTVVGLSLTVATNVAVSPDGTQNADKLEETTTTSTHRLTQGIVSSNIRYTYSCYAKKSERKMFRLASNTANGGNAIFDLDAGTIFAVNSVGTGAATAEIQNAGNGWYRCILSYTPEASISHSPGLFPVLDDGTVSYTGTTGFGVFVWGAQFEAGAFATSYIPTTASQVTRTADVATMTGTNFSDWFNATEGAFYAKWSEGNNSGLQGVLSADDGSNTNYIDIRRHNSTTVRSVVVSGGSTVADLVVNNAYAANQELALVSSYKVDSYVASANQSVVATDNLGALPVSQNQLKIGNLSLTTSRYLNGWVQKISYWPQRLTNAETRAFAK